jgi:hypothetical protein
MDDGARERTGRSEGDGGGEADEAVLLVYDGRRIGLRGRTLKLILWVAGRQARINETAADVGQLWLTWKGDGLQSIDGTLKASL